MSNNMLPQQISEKEWAEILTVRAVREGWGVQDDETGEDLANAIYGVKFDFMSGCPGYCGDLFILQGDALTGDGPMVLYRGQDGKLRPEGGDEDAIEYCQTCGNTHSGECQVTAKPPSKAFALLADVAIRLRVHFQLTDVTVEYPGYIAIKIGGHILNFGTSNPMWGADVHLVDHPERVERVLETTVQSKSTDADEIADAINMAVLDFQGRGLELT